MSIYGKTFKNLLLQNRSLGVESLLESSGIGGLLKLLNDGGTLTFDLFMMMSSLLPYAVILSPHLYGKNFENFKQLL